MSITAPVDKNSHVVLVDGSGYIFRAYHALPPLTRKSDGMPIGAVAGFSNMIFKLLRDQNNEDRPTHFAVIFDKGSYTFRNDIYDEYKANRSETPEDLIPQFPLTREATRAFGAPAIEMEGYEADDIIATYSRQAEAKGARVTIISSDKDLMQLVSNKISMLDTMKNKKISIPQVIEKFGLPPERVIEIQALAGDSVDNIPGVPGIGVKTAVVLLEQFGDLETLLQRCDEIPQKGRREKMMAKSAQKEMLFIPELNKKVSERWNENKELATSFLDDNFADLTNECNDDYPVEMGRSYMRNSRMRKICIEESFEMAINEAVLEWQNHDSYEHFSEKEDLLVNHLMKQKYSKIQKATEVK